MDFLGQDPNFKVGVASKLKIKLFFTFTSDPRKQIYSR